MVVRLYDSRSQALADLVPVVDGRVGMYVCGPTVQSSPHIGHLRSALGYDVLRRWLEHRGLAVTLVRNVTDIDDKVLANAVGAEPWWALAFRVEQEFQAAYRAIGVRPATVEPRATGHIPQMVAMIGRLIDAGHAYAASDESGDVWFDVASWPAYGELTRQRGDELEQGEADTRGKRGPRDFALWKGRKDGEPADAAWDAPWGRGRPGWHIECSAMAERYLGPEFDIHGGGLDLRFPHHENELAQSTAAGTPFARLWVHNGLVEVGGQKMSKSLGNSVFANDVLGRARPIVVRYALGAAHYRSVLEFGPRALLEAEEAVARIERFFERATAAGTVAGPLVVPDAFGAAMDDDLAVPQALAVLHETVRAGNQAVDGDDPRAAQAAFGAVRGMAAVLGIDPLDPQWSAAAGETRSDAALAALVERLIEDRADARRERDWGRADRVRGELADAGVTLADGPDGTRWTLDG